MIVATTRALFDERGRRDAPVDEIARAAKMNKALIYRAFDSKEEIFVLTVADYLAELEARGADLPEPDDPIARCARPASATPASASTTPPSSTPPWR